MPFTSLIRVFSVIVFVISAMALVLSAVSLAAPFGNFGYSAQDNTTGAVSMMLLAAIAYQLCRISEAKELSDDQVILLAAAVAELKAVRRAQQPPATPNEEQTP